MDKGDVILVNKEEIKIALSPSVPIIEPTYLYEVKPKKERELRMGEVKRGKKRMY
jgi:hypothetical protein